MPSSHIRRFKQGTLSPRTVLHVAQPVDGGVAAYVARLAKAQIERGWQVTVASPPGPLASGLQDRGIDHVHWQAKRAPGPGIVTESRALRRIIHQIDPAILHLHSSKAGVAGRLGHLGPATIFQPHGWSWDAVTGATERVVTAWERYAAPRCDLLICVSEEEQMRGSAAGLKAPWCVIENAVDLKSFPAASTSDRDQARRRLDLTTGPIAMCVGPLRYQKGQDLLVEAWPLVRDKVPEAVLVLVGDGPERLRIEQLAGAGVALAGHQDPVVPWLTAADVIVVPSRWDGLSLSLLEAMSCGRSIVANDVPGVKRVLDGGGEVVPIGDRPGLADAIVRRLQDPELTSAEGSAARRRVETNFDWAALMEKMENAYESVLPSQP